MGRIPFNQQIKNFENSLDQLSDALGAHDISQALARCIFFVGMGSNDYLNNYLMPNYPTRNQYDGNQYADLLVQEYTTQLSVSFKYHENCFVSLFYLMWFDFMLLCWICIETLQSWSPKVCASWDRANGLYSEHLGTRNDRKMLRWSEPTRSSFQCKHEDDDQQSKR